MEEILFNLNCDDTLINKEIFQEYDIMSKNLKIRCEDGCKNSDT